MKTYTRPADIENESMRIISAELKERGIEIPGNFEAVVKRVIHATADFEFAKTLTFVCGKCMDLHQKTIITDTNMAGSIRDFKAVPAEAWL